MALARASLPLAVAIAAAAAIALPAAATASPGAGQRTIWLCKPGKRHNPCTPGLATTAFSPSGAKLGMRTPRARRHRPIDCFYVYPTVSDQQTINANRHIDPEERSIALYQAARYSQLCRVYAPMYRQVTLKGIGLGSSSSSAKISAAPGEIAYRSVRSAWRDYLRHDNHGRGVVLIGHSQGSFVLRQLIAEEIDRKPAVRRRVVSAILLGGNILVRKGSDAGGDFKHVRACRSRSQLHCVVAYSTFDQPVPADAIFGRTSKPGMQVLCTNPAALRGGSAPITPIFPSQPFAPGTAIAAGIALLGVQLPTAPTPWITSPRAYDARCSSAGGAHVLQITPRDGAPVFKPSPDPTWGLHLVDANIALGNLVGLVRSESRAYVRGQRARSRHGKRGRHQHAGRHQHRRARPRALTG